jgi:hypothetical protein
VFEGAILCLRSGSGATIIDLDNCCNDATTYSKYPVVSEGNNTIGEDVDEDEWRTNNCCSCDDGSSLVVGM